MHAARTLPLAIAIALALAGAACSRPGDSAMDAKEAMAAAAPAAEMQRAAASDAAMGGVEEVKGRANRNGSQRAYAHDVRVRLAAERIAGNLGKVRDACNAQAFGACDVLGENLQAGDYPSGELRVRAAPEAVAGLVKAASDGGVVAQRSTQAEDLADAVRDNGLRRKRLELQHAKLSEILAKGQGNLDQLVAVTERLSMLEAELAAADQEAAMQQRRIATNLLSLHFEAENVSVASVASSRIGDAFRGLTSTWDQIIAWMITVFLGALLPFAVVFGVVGWLALKLFRLRRRAAP